MSFHYADSADGLTWTYGGLAFEYSESILDSVTFQVGASWHMYALIGSTTDMVHGISSDGRTFTFVGKGPSSAEWPKGGVIPSHSHGWPNTSLCLRPARLVYQVVDNHRRHKLDA